MQIPVNRSKRYLSLQSTYPPIYYYPSQLLRRELSFFFFVFFWRCDITKCLQPYSLFILQLLRAVSRLWDRLTWPPPSCACIPYFPIASTLRFKMGIKGLFSVIKEEAPAAIKEGDIKNHFGRKVAIVCP